MDDIEVSGIEAPTSVEATNPPPERTLTASEVNNIVRREKHRAAESTKRELEARHQEELERLATGQSAANPVENNGINVEEIENRVMQKFLSNLQAQKEQIEKERQEQELKEIANKYYLKMGKGSELFDDFKEVIGEFEPGAFPNAVMLATHMDNTPEIMYELANNPIKLQEIEGLAQRSPKMAQKELEKLSKSINKNVEAKNNNVTAPAPLSKLKSSSAVGMDTGKMTIKDFKNASWLKG